jgi:hypothetical protein
VTPDRRLRAEVPAVLLGGLLAAACAACGSAAPAPRATVTVTGSGPSSARGSGVTPLPTSTTTLGGTCDSVLPINAVDQAVGGPIVGTTSFIVNQPDSKIGQVERLNCRYGIAAVAEGSTQTDTKVEVSVSLYATDKEADGRVDDTVSEWRGQGAAPHAVQVAGKTGTILTGYGKPLLVLSAGPRTVAVTITPTVVDLANLDTALIALAASALRGAGG